MKPAFVNITTTITSSLNVNVRGNETGNSLNILIPADKVKINVEHVSVSFLKRKTLNNLKKKKREIFKQKIKFTFSKKKKENCQAKNGVDPF